MSQSPHAFLENRLGGAPNYILTILLVVSAGFLIVVAMKASRTAKAGVLLWTWLP